MNPSSTTASPPRNEILTTIEPSRGWFSFDWNEFWSYRGLVSLLAKRNITITYKQTILGPAWFLIQPVITSVVFSVIFGRVAGIETDGIPRMLFYMSGLLGWNYFLGVATGAGRSLVQSKALVSKIWFPRLVLPTAFVLSNLAYLSLNFLIFAGFYVYFAANGCPLRPTAAALLLPLVIVWIAAFGLGIGLLVAALTAKYRDLSFSMPFIMQMWMYATPVIYPVRGVRDPLFLAILKFNPMGPVTEILRFALMGRGTIDWGTIGCGLAVTVAALVLGFGAFNRAQRVVADHL